MIAAGVEVQTDGDQDIVGAFDGSWQKWGHTLVDAVVSATSLHTRKEMWKCYPNIVSSAAGMMKEGNITLQRNVMVIMVGQKWKELEHF